MVDLLRGMTRNGVVRRFLTVGQVLILLGVLTPTTSCKVGVEGPVDINVDQQNRGTVTGRAMINLPYQDPDASFVGASGASVRLTTGDVNTVKNTPFATTTNSDGGFLLEVAAGSYTVYGCRKTTGSGGTSVWSGVGSVTVARGATVDIGELHLRWEEGWRCGYF